MGGHRGTRRDTKAQEMTQVTWGDNRWHGGGHGETRGKAREDTGLHKGAGGDTGDAVTQ